MTTEGTERVSGAGIKAQYEAILAAAVDAIVVIDTAGCIQECNPAATRLFGYERGELVGRNVRVLMPAMYSTQHDQHLKRFVDTHEAHVIGKGREASGLRKNGEEFPIDLAVGEIRAEGETTGFVGLIRDISARKEMDEKFRHQEAEHRERLAQAARLGTLGEMAAAIAHEINQPLAAIASYADAAQRLMRNPEIDHDLVRETLGKISAQADRAGQVIRRARHFVRRRESSKARLDCNALVRDIQPLAALDARAHELMLRVSLTEEPLWVHGDSIQLQQVLLNLLRNAVDAMDVQRHGGEIDVAATRRGDDWIEIHVDDAGEGIPDEMAKHLFEPFVSTKTDGLGLGLALCRGIVEAHGGELRYTRRAEGGTRFSLLLPAADD